MKPRAGGCDGFNRPVEQLLRLGMDGDDLNCFAEELLAACEAAASAADAPCCGGQSEAWRETPGDPETTNTGSGIKETKWPPGFTGRLPALHRACTRVDGAGLSAVAGRSVAFAPPSTPGHGHGGGQDGGGRRFSHACEQRFDLLLLTRLQRLDLHHVSEGRQKNKELRA